MQTNEVSTLLDSPRIPENRRKTLEEILENFTKTEIPLEEKLSNFSNWATTRDLVRFLVRYELFQRILNVPGVIFECGVHWGGGISSWLHLSEIFEPVAFTRRVFGFDTFTGFPDVGLEDSPQDQARGHKVGDFSLGSQMQKVIHVLELQELARKVRVTDRLNFVIGDVNLTLPKLLDENPGFTISLLYLDLDLYKPTKCVLRNALPRMSGNSIVVLDQLNDSVWPGETQALLEECQLNRVNLQCFPWAPRISYFRVGGASDALAR